MLKKIILFIAFTALTLQADYLMKYNMDGEINTFLYKDANHVKLITHEDKQGGSSTIYSLNKKVYVVTDEDGMLSIVDTQKAKSFMDSMGINIVMPEEDNQENTNFTIKKTGKKELVAGIEGDVWILSDKGEQSRVVVTNNKNVVKMTQNMAHLFSKMSGSEQNFYEIKKGYVLIKAEGIKLEKFTKKKVAKSEYILPKKASSKKPSQRSRSEEQLDKSGDVTKMELKHKSLVVRKKNKTKVTHKVEKKEPKEESVSDSINKETIDKAANLLKSFF